MAKTANAKRIHNRILLTLNKHVEQSGSSFCLEVKSTTERASLLCSRLLATKISDRSQRSSCECAPSRAAMVEEKLFVRRHRHRRGRRVDRHAKAAEREARVSGEEETKGNRKRPKRKISLISV